MNRMVPTSKNLSMVSIIRIKEIKIDNYSFATTIL